jgi:hypothetical protein
MQTEFKFHETKKRIVSMRRASYRKLTDKLNGSSRRFNSLFCFLANRIYLK